MTRLYNNNNHLASKQGYDLHSIDREMSTIVVALIDLGPEVPFFNYLPFPDCRQRRRGLECVEEREEHLPCEKFST